MGEAERGRAPAQEEEQGRREGGRGVGARVADREQLTRVEEERVDRERSVHDIEDPVERGS